MLAFKAKSIVSLFLNKTYLSFFCVSEHWLREEEMQFYHSIEQFKLVTSFSRRLTKNGGVTIYKLGNEKTKSFILTISLENSIWK